MTVVFVTLGFIVGSIGLAWFAYFGMRALAASRADQETRDLAGGVVRGIAAVQGLILAFVFSQELYEYQRVREALVEEATAVGDIYYDIGRYDAPRAHEVRTALIDYVRHVAAVEWDELGRSERLSQHGWDLREAVYGVVLDLEPETPREQDLRAHMIDRVQRIGELRWLRESSAHAGVLPAFWLAIGTGLVLVSAALFTYPPRLVSLALLSFYAGFLGLLLLFVFAFSNPFGSPWRIAPTEFQHMFVGEFGQQLRAGRD